MGVQRTARLLEAGVTHRALEASGRSGERVLVRHGAWSDEAPTDDLTRHRQLVEGTWPLLAGQAVLSHGTAAVLHGLPIWRAQLDRVSVTRSEGGHGTRTRHLHVRRASLDPCEVVELDGYRVTSLERTALDLAALLDYERAVAVLDAALHRKADATLMDALARAARNRRGAGVARRALAFADGRAESVGESVSRVRMAQLGLPAPELQFEVFDGKGLWIARVDFAWPDRGVVGEFDGAVKYTGAPKEVAAVVMQEKRRHQAIEEVGWRVVRWGFRDMDDRERFRDRLASALDLGPLRRPV
jgi:hypothetical protein